MSTRLFARVHSEIVETVALALSQRSTSVYGRLGLALSRRHVDRALTALEHDLAVGKREQIRATMQALIEELWREHVTFSDLRFFTQSLRSALLRVVEAESAELRQPVDDWCFELVLINTMRFHVLREAQVQEHAAKLELQQLEGQLVELQAALAEKTRLLEVIRQASTPIAPVVQGILVVPLVGTFDGFRAEILTDKLLHEVSRLRARAVILDISGVPMFDTQAAQLIIRLARTVKMLGCKPFVVGISPEGARTIVEIGVDLSDLETAATLREGLARALRLQRLAIVPLGA